MKRVLLATVSLAAAMAMFAPAQAQSRNAHSIAFGSRGGPDPVVSTYGPVAATADTVAAPLQRVAQAGAAPTQSPPTSQELRALEHDIATLKAEEKDLSNKPQVAAVDRAATDVKTQQATVDKLRRDLQHARSKKQAIIEQHQLDAAQRTLKRSIETLRSAETKLEKSDPKAAREYADVQTRLDHLAKAKAAGEPFKPAKTDPKGTPDPKKHPDLAKAPPPAKPPAVKTANTKAKIAKPAHAAPPKQKSTVVQAKMAPPKAAPPKAAPPKPAHLPAPAMTPPVHH